MKRRSRTGGMDSMRFTGPGFSEMAGHIAHEISNPLEYMGNYLFLLGEALPSGFEKKEYLEKIERGLGNLAELSRKLLELSWDSTADFIPVRLDHVLESALVDLQQHRMSSVATVSKSYDGQNCTIIGSERMLHVIFTNVLRNALESLDEQKGGILVSLVRRGNMARITIADSGSGMTGENLQQVFHPFFTTKRSIEQRGTGLGMTICYNFVRLHQGAIRIESSLGRGTRVTIALPLMLRR